MSIFHNLCLLIEFILSFCGSISITSPHHMQGFANVLPPIWFVIVDSYFSPYSLPPHQKLFLVWFTETLCPCDQKYPPVSRCCFPLIQLCLLNITLTFSKYATFMIVLYLPVFAVRIPPPLLFLISDYFDFSWAVKSAMPSNYFEMIIALVCILDLSSASDLAMCMQAYSNYFSWLLVACCIAFAPWKHPHFGCRPLATFILIFCINEMGFEYYLHFFTFHFIIPIVIVV